MITDRLYDIIKDQPEDARVHLVMDKAALELQDKGLLRQVVYLNDKLHDRIDKERTAKWPYALMRDSYEHQILNGIFTRALKPKLIDNAQIRASIVGYEPSNVIPIRKYITEKLRSIVCHVNRYMPTRYSRKYA